MSKRLYVCPLPTTAQRRRSQGQETQRNITANGILNSDAAAVEPISTGASGTPIDGQYRGQYADVMATELRELSESSGYGTVPYYDTDGRSSADGYYSIEQLDAQPTTPNTDLVQQYQGRLSKSGTRDSHLRAVTTEPRTVDHPWGTDTTALVSAPAAATDVRWVNPVTEASEPAMPLATHAAEHGDVTTYDLADASFWSPTEATGDGRGPILVYDIAYDAIGPTDVRVWDRRGYATRDDSDGLPRWAKVFVSTHNFGGDACVIENGRRRVTLDPSADPGLAVEQWDDANSQWTDTALDTSGDAADWTLLAFDLARRTDQSLAPTRVDALTRWEHTDGSTHALDLTLRRGSGDVQFAQLPDASGPVPSGLVTLLEPVASERIVHPTAGQTIRARSKVGES